MKIKLKLIEDQVLAEPVKKIRSLIYSCKCQDRAFPGNIYNHLSSHVIVQRLGFAASFHQPPIQTMLFYLYVCLEPLVTMKSTPPMYPPSSWEYFSANNKRICVACMTIPK